MESTVWLRSISATSCQWLLTLQQCGSFVGKRLLVEGLFTAFNEGAASAATNQRSSEFLDVTQRLHKPQGQQVKPTATHYCCLVWGTKANFESFLPLGNPPRFQWSSSPLCSQSCLSILGWPTFLPPKTTYSSFLTLCDVWKASLFTK